MKETGNKIIQYDCGRSYSSCFNISGVIETWEIANSTCARQGGRLLHPFKDLIGFDGIPSNAGGEYYWTEIHRVPNTEYFQTTDGKKLTDYYSNSRYWKANHPIDGIDCVGFDEESYELMSLECNTTHLAVCRIDACDTSVEEYEDICPSLALRPEMLTENSLSINLKVTTGDYIQLYNYGNELVVTQVSANTSTKITFIGDSVQISEDPFEARKIFVWEHYPDYYNSTFILDSYIFTVYTSSISSFAELTVVFSGYYLTEEDKCVHLTPEGNWSTEGVETEIISNRTVQCTTIIKNINTIALAKFKIPIEIRDSLISLSIIIAFIFIFLLLSSVVMLIASKKKLFSLDRNILQFYYSLSLFIALLSIPLIALPIYFQFSCLPISFLLLFLWTNVFITSLSMTIVVFYSIWIVTINRTARKLYKYLILIGWGVSFVWAAAWTNYRHFVLVPSSRDLCYFSPGSKLEIDLSFFGPIIVILFIDIALLIASLVIVWLVLRKQSSQEGELRRLRKEVFGYIVLLITLGLHFISLHTTQLYAPPEGPNEIVKNIFIFLILFLINLPLGLIHFITIIYQTKEIIISRYFCCCYHRITAQISHCPHLNILRPRPKQKNHETLIEDSTIQQIPDDTIPDSVPSNDSAVYSNDSTQAVI